MVATFDTAVGDTFSRAKRVVGDEDAYGISGFFKIVDSLETISENCYPSSLGLNVYPNPFNSSISITTPQNTVIEILDINGRLVWTSPKSAKCASPIVWRTESNISSGIYLVRAKIGDKEITKRVVYLK
jgi:hypothetical protein